MKTDCIAIVLAAGKGTRMKSDIPKVLHEAAGKPLAAWVMDAAREVTGRLPVIVTSQDSQPIRDMFGDSAAYAVQSEQRGTGHAVMAAREYLVGDGYALVVAGDMPMIRAETLADIVTRTIEGGLGACLLSAVLPDPSGYGRIVRDTCGVKCIVEHKDADDDALRINEVNASIYCFHIPLLLKALDSLKSDNAQGEYYLTDCIEHIAKSGAQVQSIVCSDCDECMGVNDKVQLAAASKVLRRRINEDLMRGGVTMIDPDATYIDADVRIGPDTTIYPGVTIEGSSTIGSGTVLYPGSRIQDSTIGDGTVVQNAVILQSQVGDNTTIGPYAYLRPHSVVGNGCRVGDFVEVKNAEIKDGAKVSHLSYIGDGEIGEKSNIGCGVVFVNYDGKTKSKTTVGKNVFVGCNANLVAPVTIHDGAYVAAGSTVTHDVPEDALCVARSRQKNIEGWAKRRREQ